MRRLSGIIGTLPVLALANCVALWKLAALDGWAKVLIVVALSVYFIAFICKAHGNKASEGKLKRLDFGAYLLWCGVFANVLQLAVIIMLCFSGLNVWRIVINCIAAYLIILILCMSGILRISFSARQVKVLHYVVLLFTWYIPVINCLVFRKFYKTARSEYHFEQAKLDLDEVRKESEVCHTKYPILMVHGIFFRDWQVMNYWGRIPQELIKNGAVIYYGGQQSANKISLSAQELADKIKSVLEETGAEKVNIIAHSKGGLDSRYAISHLGMDKYVASLTTINTPHCGCKFVDMLLKKIPDSIVKMVDGKYNRIFKALGDSDPSFYNGVYELTYESCRKMNEITPDSPDVYYRSVMTKMNSIRAAGFPLNFGYLLNKPYGKGNDGLVTVESGLYGENRRLVEHKGKRGISHGDVIDLFRDNIKDFDVREFYVGLVKELKERGY